MMKIALYLFLAYIAYRFIFGFVIPVTKATRTVRQQFKAAQDEMESQMRAQQEFAQRQQTNSSSATRPNSGPNSKDYIEFEELP